MIEVRKIRPSDISSVIRLNNNWYAYNWPKQFYHWQYFENVHRTVVMVALEDNEVIGSFGIQVRQVSGRIRCGQISWITVARERRCQGIFKKLGQAVK